LTHEIDGKSPFEAQNRPAQNNRATDGFPILLFRYRRETLYKEVRRQPVQELARKYGVSDGALWKACRKLLIPLPGKGYWARRKAGKPVPMRPPLPPVVPLR
jgi:hypothetical protein